VGDLSRIRDSHVRALMAFEAHQRAHRHAELS